MKENEEDVALWKTFKMPYTKASKTLIGESKLPLEVIAAVERGREKRSRNFVKNLFGL
jgi:hypothetical protein